MESFLAQLKEELKDVSTINFDAIEARAREVYSDLESQKTKLLTKNNELLGKNKKLKEEGASFDADRVELERLKDEEQKRLDNPTSKIDMEEVKRGVERQYKAEKEKLLTQMGEKEKEIKERDSYIDDFVIKNALNEYLGSGVPVVDAFKPILTKSFKSDAVVSIDDDGDRVVYMKSKESDGLIPVKDFFASWKSSEEAKAFLVAESSNGSGARGNFRGNSFHKQKDPKDYSLSEQSKLYKENPEKWRRLFDK